jgi:eukaryotic-like serine/threonine-protein kinase
MSEPSSDDSDSAPTVNGGPGAARKITNVDEPLEPVRAGIRYTDRGVLGVGGMGEVRLCQDLMIGRDVALKRSRLSVTDGPTGRFLREARIQGQLEHPAIVPVYDLGLDQTGAPYFTMKRVRGQTLSAVIKRLAADDPDFAQRYSRRRLLSAFSTLCLALDFAHQRGALHRDLKPANVMLGEFGEVHVLDWGIARLMDVDGPDAVTDLVRGGPHTETGAMIGTVGYMSPEQIGGGLLGPASDVYALGCILFELVAFERLNRGATTDERIAVTLRGTADRLRERCQALSIPPELEVTISQATTTDLAARTPTARQLSETIERFLDGDRDLERRRNLADEHTIAAEKALSSHAPAARATAMQELTRALAFVPQHPTALRLLQRLLSEFPDELPPAAEAEFQTAESATRQAGLRIGAVRFASWLAFVPAVVVLGVREWSYTLAAAALMLVGLFTSIVLARSQRRTERSALFIAALSAGCLVLVSRLFGPLVLVPGLLATTSIFFATFMSGRARVVAWALTLVPVLGPLLFEALGLVHQSYEFRDGQLCVAPNMASFPPIATLVVLTVASLAVMTTTTALVWRLRDRLTRIERQRFVHAWHLRQLAPQ